MNQKIRIGVLGCAAIAERSMIPAILNMPEHFELIAVASRTHEKANNFAQLFNCEGIVGYDQLIAREDIDALYIPLPSGLHHEWIPKALKSGKHVYAEKSIALDFNICEQMVLEAKKNQVALMEGFMFQYHSQHKEIQELIQSGAIGELRHFSASFGFPSLPEGNFRYYTNLGGGALYDAGAYLVRAAFMFLGNDLSVKGASLMRSPNSATQFGSAYLHGSNGVGASISFGFDNFYQCNYTFWGSTGKLTAERAFTPRPDMNPLIIIENNDGSSTIEAAADNHFEKALLEFHSIIINPPFREKHFLEIIQQSKALHNINTIG